MKSTTVDAMREGIELTKDLIKRSYDSHKVCIDTLKNGNSVLDAELEYGLKFHAAYDMLLISIYETQLEYHDQLLKLSTEISGLLELYNVDLTFDQFIKLPEQQLVCLEINVPGLYQKTMKYLTIFEMLNRFTETSASVAVSSMDVFKVKDGE